MSPCFTKIFYHFMTKIFHQNLPLSALILFFFIILGILSSNIKIFSINCNIIDSYKIRYGLQCPNKYYYMYLYIFYNTLDYRVTHQNMLSLIPFNNISYSLFIFYVIEHHINSILSRYDVISIVSFYLKFNLKLNSIDF